MYKSAHMYVKHVYIVQYVHIWVHISIHTYMLHICSQEVCTIASQCNNTQEAGTCYTKQIQI